MPKFTITHDLTSDDKTTSGHTYESEGDSVVDTINDALAFYADAIVRISRIESWEESDDS